MSYSPSPTIQDFHKQTCQDSSNCAGIKQTSSSIQLIRRNWLSPVQGTNAYVKTGEYSSDIRPDIDPSIQAGWNRFSNYDLDGINYINYTADPTDKLTEGSPTSTNEAIRKCGLDVKCSGFIQGPPPNYNTYYKSNVKVTPKVGTRTYLYKYNKNNVTKI
jgi:hypothetical protein